MSSVTSSEQVVHRRTVRLGVASVVVLLALSAYTTLFDPAPKLLSISWVAFAAMAGFAYLGANMGISRPSGVVWGYGLASGAMITSAAVFLVPSAIGHHPQFGGFGIAVGILFGYAAHTIGHRLTHLDLPLNRPAAELAAHAITAGSIMGIVYTAMPQLGPLLGLTIISHKGPAGYVAARRSGSASMLLLPSAAVGIAALTVSLVQPPSSPIVQGLLFGFASGVFLHVAMDFLPECETGSEIHDMACNAGHAHDHGLLDRLRTHAVVSTVTGGLVVFAAWLLLA